MAWSTIRRATGEEKAKLEKAARQFAARHEIDLYDGLDPVLTVEGNCEPGYGAGDYEKRRARRLNRLWLRVVRRVLGDASADGIAYGYVGRHAE